MLGAVCGLLIASPVAAIATAIVGGFTIDFIVQTASQYIENKEINLDKIDYGRSLKTGIQVGLGVAIPIFGQGKSNYVDAVGTALIWGEISTMITIVDVIISNIIKYTQDIK